MVDKSWQLFFARAIYQLCWHNNTLFYVKLKVEVISKPADTACHRERNEVKRGDLPRWEIAASPRLNRGSSQ